MQEIIISSPVTGELKTEELNEVFNCERETCNPKTDLSGFPDSSYEGSRIDVDLKRMILLSLGFKDEKDNKWSHYILGSKKGEVIIDFDLAMEPLNGLLVKFLEAHAPLNIQPKKKQ